MKIGGIGSIGHKYCEGKLYDIEIEESRTFYDIGKILTEGGWLTGRPAQYESYLAVHDQIFSGPGILKDAFFCILHVTISGKS